MIAATAATVVLGSAAAYAITLPDLPVDLPGISLDMPIDLPDPLVSPPDTKLPANPIVGTPDGDELSEIAGALDPASAASKKPVAGPKPAAKRQAPAPEAAAAPSKVPDKVDKVAPDDDDLEDLKSLEDLLSDEDWAKWREGRPDGSIDVTIGRGINICNNNNVKVIVNRDSHDDENTVEQHNSSNDVVASVDGEDTDAEGSGISCEH